MTDTGVHVTGSGRAGAVPDVMVLDAGVEAAAADPGRAFEQAKRALEGLREAVLATGVEVRDLQTSQVRLHPHHDGNGFPSGHQASLGLRIVVRDLAQSGTVIDAVTAGAGENARLHGIRLDHHDSAGLEEQARAAAVAAARTRAQALAGQVGRQLGRCIRVEEFASRPGVQPMMASARAGLDPGLAVDGGEIEVEVSVQAVWEFADTGAADHD